MSKAASKTMIGAFVLGAVTLAVIGVAVFGSGRFFRPTVMYETYFQGSVKGLNVGAPVMFRGVEIGAVKEISLVYDPSNLEFTIPVIFEIYPEKARRLGPPREMVKGELIQPLIDRGLRTQLISLSLITGQLAVAIDFFPEKKVVYVALDKRYPEIPSVPSGFQELQATLEEMPFQEILVKLDSAMEGINSIVNSKSAQESVKSLEKMLSETTLVLNSLQREIIPLSESLQSTSGEIRLAVSRIDGAMSGKDGVLESSKKSLAQAEQTLLAMQELVQNNSAMGYDLGMAVAEMSRSLRAMRALSDYLERHPESLIRGKRSP